MSNIYPKAFAFVLGVVFFVSNSVNAQVPVALPTAYFDARDIALPLTVGDVSGEDIKAFLLTMTYDDSVLEITGVDAQGDLAENFSLIINTDTPGHVTVGGAHYEAIEGDGALIHLNARILKKGTTNLTLDSFSFNEGFPQVATQNGEVSNSAVNVSNEETGALPESFELLGNYPNPFNPTTTIQFNLPETAEVTVEIVDLLGRPAMTIPAQVYQAGALHRIDVDASTLASGVYMYRVKAQGVSRDYLKSATMTLIK